MFVSFIAVGAINESDVTLLMPQTVLSLVSMFVQTVVQNVQKLKMLICAEFVIEEIESAMKGLLDPEFEEQVIGQAEVRQTFKVSKVGTIAGCYVTEGKITRNAGVRIIRDGIVQYEGELDTLKRFKDDAKEVAKVMNVVLQLKTTMTLKRRCYRSI